MRVSVWVRKIIQVAMFYKTRIKSASRTLRVAPNKCPLKILPQPPGGALLGYFLGGYVPPLTPNWHPVLKKISPKIDT